MRIKTFLLVAVFCMVSILKAQEQPENLLSLPNPIELDSTEYYLVWTKQQSKTLFRQQYLPIDEQIEDFTQLLDFSYINKEIEMELAVRQKVESIQKMSKNDKFAKVNVAENPTSTEFIVDYFSSHTPTDGDPYIQFAMDRFVTIEHGNQKSFLILTYVKRMYGDIKSNYKSLSRQRDHLMSTLIEYKIPEINVAAAPN